MMEIASLRVENGSQTEAREAKESPALEDPGGMSPQAATVHRGGLKKAETTPHERDPEGLVVPLRNEASQAPETTRGAVARAEGLPPLGPAPLNESAPLRHRSGAGQPHGVRRTSPSRRALGEAGARTNRTGLTISDQMPMSTWRKLGRRLSLVSDSSCWWLGDWLIYGQTHYPDRYRQALAETSLDYQTLRNYAWVARRFEPYRRRDRLSFQHHAEVASLDAQRQDELLTQAEEEAWSRNELRRRARGSREIACNTSPPSRIQLSVVDDKVRRWKEAAQRADQDLTSWMVTILDVAAT